MLLTDYIIKYENFITKPISYKMEIHDGVLTCRRLDIANLFKNNKQLVKATLSEVKYSAMKKKLKKVFTSQNTSVLDVIKLERVKTS